MFNEMNKIEEMMVDFCEYNPMIFAQKSALKKETKDTRSRKIPVVRQAIPCLKQSVEWFQNKRRKGLTTHF